jgi:hypothetical protein
VAKITVEPSSFALVKYDSLDIAAIAERVATGIGFPANHSVDINVEESTPLTRVSIESLSPLTISVEGGAFEDPHRPRSMSEALTAIALARVLFQAAHWSDSRATDCLGCKLDWP